MASKVLNTILSLQDNASKKLIGVSSNFKNLSKEAQKATLSAQKSLDNLGKGIEKTVTNAASKVAKIGTVLGALGIGTGLSEAMDLEGYKTQLETATKSTQKAAEIMKYSIDLANKTPFEGGEMVEASSKLESMGISAKSYLSQIVDMAAATNKPLDQATEAFIDAQTGELERLKEFGIKKADIQAKANEMFAGQETINNQGQITNQENFNKALLAIMENRYTGGAEKLSKTTKGMWSTITGVTKNALAKIVGIQDDGTVKSGTLIDKIREKMQLLGDKLTKWQSDGTLDNIASKATQVFNTIYNVVSKVFNFVVQHKDIIITIASMAVAFTVVSKAIRGLSIATKAFQVIFALLNGTLALSPIGWIIIGISLLVGAFVLAYQKSDKFRNMCSLLLIKIKELGTSILSWYNSSIKPILTQIMQSLSKLWNQVLIPFGQWLSKTFGPLFEAIFKAIGSTVGPIFTIIGDYIKNTLKIFQGLIDFLTGVFTGDWDLAWKGIKEIVVGTIDRITELWNGLKKLIQAPINAVVNVEKKVYGDSKGWNPLTGIAGMIGKHANGTNYYKGGYTWVGEHGPELMKLPGGTQIKTNSQSKKIANEKSNMPPIQVIIQGNVIGNESFIDQVGNTIYNKIQIAMANM
ncbi:conserved hypothetical protein [Clostridium neonatale]|uniref:hypothetical protein n=1 Tax=Clostridium neonatale TaxID=137838 RepID=UPI00291BB66A|nr:hypothetical protein [Clostridium neonatale]CAI3699939.1 conserved hypothetical protein [Clostridium neonatale]